MSNPQATAAAVTERIQAELRQVVDPCSVQVGRPMDVVSMGLIEKVSYDAGKVDIQLLLTDSTCIFFFKFAAEIEERVSRLDDVESVDVTLNEDRLWTPERIAKPPAAEAPQG